MMTIHLHKLHFFSYHGLHDEEKLTGGEFEVNLSVKYKPVNLPVHHLHETVDYVTLYSMVKKRMNEPSELLETIATELSEQILAQFSIVEEVEISITKLHPPIVGFEGSVGVSYVKRRDNL